MIAEPYLIVLNIALVRDGGRYWCEPLWRKDLLLHFVGIEAITLACPIEHRAAPPTWLPLEHPGLTIVGLPPMRWTTLLALPLIAWRIDRCIKVARTVHTGVAGWPFPLGWIAVPIARMRGRLLLIGVESSFWRIPRGTLVSWPRRMWARLFERINRACLDAADLAFFTTEDYRVTLLHRPRGQSHVTPASWVDADRLLAPDALQDVWSGKDGRLLFAGRLNAAKGVAVLLEAARLGTARIDIIGEGELIEACRAAAAAHPDRIRLLDPVPYGEAFFALLDSYSALVVPTISEEQPRVIFDAFSRAVPVIASDTSGNRELVRDGVNGRLVPAGDAAALARAMDAVEQDAAVFRRMGEHALVSMGPRTHEAMHRHRTDLIEEALRRRRAP